MPPMTADYIHRIAGEVTASPAQVSAVLSLLDGGATIPFIARYRTEATGALDEVVVTDSIPLREDARNCSKIRVLSVVDLLAETVLRISNEESVSSLFSE